MNFDIISLIIFTVFCAGSANVTLECLYLVHQSYGYKCEVQNSVLITSEGDRTISEVRGQHLRGKTNDDVKYFISYSKQIDFFPRGLTKFFKNIEIVEIRSSKLKEIIKEDLKEFGDKLKELMLYPCEIEVIQSDLFEFNRNLARFDINHNKIRHIGDKTFDGLEKLKTIFLSPNPCFPSESSNKHNDSSKVLQIIRDDVSKCKDPNYVPRTRVRKKKFQLFL